MMFGVAFLAPLLVRPLARVLGRPMARFQGLTGKLARENAIRQPQRTAVTAAALMVGLALVVLVAIFAAGLSASINKTIDDQMQAAMIVQNEDGFSPISAQVVQPRQGRAGRRERGRVPLRAGHRRRRRRGDDRGQRHRPGDGRLDDHAQVGPGRRGARSAG